MSNIEIIIISVIVGFVGYVQGTIATRRRLKIQNIAIRAEIIQSAYDQGFQDGNSTK